MGFFEDLLKKGGSGEYLGEAALGPAWNFLVKPAVEQAVPFWMRKTGEALQSPTALELASDPAALAATGESLTGSARQISDATEQQRQAREAQIGQLTKKPSTIPAKAAPTPPNAPPSTPNTSEIVNPAPTQTEKPWQPGFDEGTGASPWTRDQVVDWRMKALQDKGSQAGPFAVRAGRSAPTFTEGDPLALRAAAEYSGTPDVTNRVGPQPPSAGGFMPSEKVPPVETSTPEFLANLRSVTNPLIREQMLSERGQLAGVTSEEAKSNYLTAQGKLLEAQAAAQAGPGARRDVELSYWPKAMVAAQQLVSSPDVQAEIETKAKVLADALAKTSKVKPGSTQYVELLDSARRKLTRDRLQQEAENIIQHAGGGLGAAYARNPMFGMGGSQTQMP